jgi:hypothetical protein
MHTRGLVCANQLRLCSSFIPVLTLTGLRNTRISNCRGTTLFVYLYTNGLMPERW